MKIFFSGLNYAKFPEIGFEEWLQDGHFAALKFIYERIIC